MKDSLPFGNTYSVKTVPVFNVYSSNLYELRAESADWIKTVGIRYLVDLVPDKKATAEFTISTDRVFPSEAESFSKASWALLSPLFFQFPNIFGSFISDSKACVPVLVSTIFTPSIFHIQKCLEKMNPKNFLFSTW